MEGSAFLGCTCSRSKANRDPSPPSRARTDRVCVAVLLLLLLPPLTREEASVARTKMGNLPSEITRL